MRADNVHVGPCGQGRYANRDGQQEKQTQHLKGQTLDLQFGDPGYLFIREGFIFGGGLQDSLDFRLRSLRKRGIDAGCNGEDDDCADERDDDEAQDARKIDRPELAEELIQSSFGK